MFFPILATPQTNGLSPEAHRLACASALLWTFRSRSELQEMASHLGLLNAGGRPYTGQNLKDAIQEIHSHDLLVEDMLRPGHFRLVDSLRVPLYRQWLATTTGTELANLLVTCGGLRRLSLNQVFAYGERAQVVALLRARVLGGARAPEIQAYRATLETSHEWSTLIAEAILEPFDAQSFAGVCPEWRWRCVVEAASETTLRWPRTLMPVIRWALDEFRARPTSLPSLSRLALADLALQRGDGALVAQLLQGIDNAPANALRAGVLAFAGQWDAAQTAFDAAIKQRQTETKLRKRIFPASIAWLYPLILLAQATPKHLEIARKFCLGEAGKRDPDAYDPWGQWVNAIDSRLGHAPLVPGAFALHAYQLERPSLGLLWKVLLAAWVGPEALGGEALSPADSHTSEVDVLDALASRFEDFELAGLGALLSGAKRVLAGEPPPAGFFIRARGEAWREVLAALQALGEVTDGVKPASGEPTRLQWQLAFSAEGELTQILPYEQKRSARGWSKPKPLTLGKLAAKEDLPPWDAKVARCVRPNRHHASRHTLDLAAAIGALVGHPVLVLAQAPEQLLDLLDTPPELEVVRVGEHFQLAINPPPRPEPEFLYYLDAEQRRDREALRQITLLQDSPQRIRLVRYTPAHRRVAQLVSGRFSVPASAPHAQEELTKTLQALAGHFQVQADSAQASRQVPPESLLRAELAPVGDSLSLRLVVTPLGPEGPRLSPGRGRPRIMAAIGAETLGTERDLVAEQRHLDAVLHACAFLEERPASDDWLIDDPEQALELVEVLPGLPSIAAVEWPRGQRVRVITLDPGRLGISVNRERDWFRVDAQIELDAGLVMHLEALLAAGHSKSRFVPMGGGVYAALTRSLKQKLRDLAAVTEADKQGHKVPQIAAVWPDEILDGTAVEPGTDFRLAIERLSAARLLTPVLPKSLQAELRPYQEEGYQWAMRLASAGMGGCLADDMGLGKTVQALAVLLARASGGAALVIAPTSVCGNWLAEALRFAPSLQVRIYSEASDAEQAQWVAEAGPQDVIVVSYTLLQLGQARFGAREWHTIIADEAQAIKNATAKRSQAVFDLTADFRLALSGTPVENRLTELWSIMCFVNPGLLGTIGRFNERFAGPIERNRDREAQHVLKRLIGPFVLRRTKAQVLDDLPPRVELLLSVVPEAEEAAHYEALRRQAAREISALAEQPGGSAGGQARFNILAQLTKLRRAACDPRLGTPAYEGVGAKVRAFAELAAELTANGHKALVFSQFVDFLRILRAPLDAAGIRYQYLDGATPAAERTKRVAAFQAGEGELFLISLKAGGFGLNLTAADYVVITDPWWNPAAEDQAMGRAHRMGQLRPVTVYRLVSRGTIEERIVDLHHDKRALADSILADGDSALLPATEDLIALIRGD